MNADELPAGRSHKPSLGTSAPCVDVRSGCNAKMCMSLRQPPRTSPFVFGVLGIDPNECAHRPRLGKGLGAAAQIHRRLESRWLWPWGTFNSIVVGLKTSFRQQAGNHRCDQILTQRLLLCAALLVVHGVDDGSRACGKPKCCRPKAARLPRSADSWASPSKPTSVAGMPGYAAQVMSFAYWGMTFEKVRESSTNE